MKKVSSLPSKRACLYVCLCGLFPFLGGTRSASAEAPNTVLLDTSSARWISSRAASSETDRAGGLRQDLSESSQILTYLTAPGQVVDLAPRQSLRAVVAFRLEGAIEDGFFRLGLFDTSEQSRVTRDGGGLSHAGFTGARGYMLNLAGTEAGRAVDWRRRQPDTNLSNLMSTLRAYWLAEGSEAELMQAFVPDQVYRATIDISCLHEGAMRTRAVIDGPAGRVVILPAVEDHSRTAHARFDTLALIAQQGLASQLVIESVTVTTSGTLSEKAPPVETASSGQPSKFVSEAYPAVPAFDPSRVNPTDFSAGDLRNGWMTYSMPYYLTHLAELANSIVVSGPEAGWISRRAWRSDRELRDQDPRVMENVLSLAYFYSHAAPWNVYYGNDALRRRLELAIRYYVSEMDESGLMVPRPASQHVGLRLATTMFFTKFIGETLVLLEQGPTIDPEVLEALYSAQRNALMHVLNSDLASVQGRQFSNQYGNIFSGAYAYLSLRDDPEIERLLNTAIRDVVPSFQSPAGYLYENHSVDFGYSLGTHHSNVHGAWHFGEVAGKDLHWLREETTLWTEWLAYNAVPNPDFSWFTLNRGIEGRQDKAGFDRVEAPFARDVPLMRAFVASQPEVETEDRKNRDALARTWPRVGSFGRSFHSFSPYAFLHRSHFEWFPSEDERKSARQTLPYLARDSFTHQRVDDRRHLEVSFVRRSAYYATFNAGESMSSVQTFGLGLLWHPQMGAVLQSQTRMAEAAWGTRIGNQERVVEADELEVRYFVDGKEISPRSGNDDLSAGDFEIHYRLEQRNEKILRFEDERILVVVNPGGAFTEQIPLLHAPGEAPEIIDGTVRLRHGGRTLVIRPEGVNAIRINPTDRQVGPYMLAVVELEGFRRCTYTLSFE